MDTILMEKLLNEEESPSLDFKKEQYLFDNTDFAGLGYTPDQVNKVKSELLKDILAFANSWRRTDAYILFGVEDVKGSRSILHGITKHIDDAKIQQFVNSKTQKPLTFSYEAFPFEKVSIGIIRIPVQERPFFILNDYGKLKKDIVYLRRGSSTDEARLEEVLRLAKSDYETKEAMLLQPIFDAHAIGHGNSIALTLWNKGETVKNINIEWDNEPFPKASWANQEPIEITIKTSPNQYVFPFTISYEDKLGNKFIKQLSYDMERTVLNEIETQKQ